MISGTRHLACAVGASKQQHIIITRPGRHVVYRLRAVYTIHDIPYVGSIRVPKNLRIHFTRVRYAHYERDRITRCAQNR